MNCGWLDSKSGLRISVSRCGTSISTSMQSYHIHSIMREGKSPIKPRVTTCNRLVNNGHLSETKAKAGLKLKAVVWG